MALIPIIAAIVLVVWRARQLEPQGIAPLTSLRAFAAAMVFALHFSENYRADHPDNILTYFLSGGYEGVSVFFVLSGFLLTLAMLRDLKASAFNLRQYFVRRAARIYPLYYALLAATFLLAPQTVHWQHVLMIQGFFPETVLEGIPTSWTLTVEECFYVLLPIIIWTCLKAPWHEAVTLVGWGVSLFLIGLLLIELRIPGFLISVQYTWILTIFGRFPIFAVGIICAFLYKQHKQWPLALLICFTLLFFAAVYETTSVENTRPNFRLAEDMVIGLAAGGMILGLASDNWLTRFLGNRYFVYLGLISYALYLLQLTPLMAWIPNLVHSLPDLIAAYAVATLLSMACYEFVERPARVAILRRFGQKQKGHITNLQQPAI